MVEQRSLQTTKKFVDELLTWARGRGKILIVVHDNPDPDCLASAMALRHLFVMKLNREAIIAFSGMIGRSENIVMAKELEIPLKPLTILNLQDFSVVCMLDTQPGTGNNSLPSGTRVDVVIDHHPLRETSTLCHWVDIREDYGVTATILYEYLVVQDVPISTKLATAVYYAIKSETQDLGREANKPDRDAYLRLFPLANKRLLYEITYPKLPVEYFLTLNRAIENTRLYSSLLVTDLGELSFPEIVAEMADLFLRLEKIEVVFASGCYNNEIILSLRTNRSDINAGELSRRIVAGLGLAGGHGMMAGGKVCLAMGRDEVAEHLLHRLLAELSLEKEIPVALDASHYSLGEDAAANRLES
ncbi:DHH family phosphoesterase [Geotalea uraniireducens]|nr:DHH family phosphoesterase [Geotalea uraniireducens]